MTRSIRSVIKWVTFGIAISLVSIGWYHYGFALWNAYQWLSWALTFAWFGLLISGIAILLAMRSKPTPTWIPENPAMIGTVAIATAIGGFLLIRATPSFPAVNENFHRNLHGRERVARELLPKITPGYQQHVLTPADRNLVTEDEAYSFKEDKGTWIFFPVLRHTPDNFFGFVFSESGERPPSRSFGDVTQCRELQPNWFWISTT